MNFDKFTVDQKVVFIGDPDKVKNQKGEKMYCPLKYGNAYRISSIFFWGKNELLKLEGIEEFWSERMFVSKKEFKKINNFVSEILN